MIKKTLVKIELGCGSKKTAGFIGVDRFALPGVDIVATIDKELPFKNDFADVIYAQHSLEHFNNFTSIMEEIYRICKHKALVMILAPYYFTTTNISNPYHYQPFTEDTLRFFSGAKTSIIDPKEIERPNAMHYGLITSDNSKSKVEFVPLSLEFFYYPGYRHLPAEQKRILRRSFLNVCDQFFLCAIVNKKEEDFSDAEIEKLLEFAKEQEPIIVEVLRQRDQVLCEEDFVLAPFITPLGDKLKQDIEISSFQLRENLFEQIGSTKQELNAELSRIKLIATSLEHESAELMKSYLNRRRIRHMYYFYNANRNIESTIFSNYTIFSDTLLRKSPDYESNSILSLSAPLYLTEYSEYKIKGEGAHLTFFVTAGYGAHLLIEFVAEEKIIGQQHVTLKTEGVVSVPAPCKQEMYVRFRVTNNSSIVRLLEIENRRFCLFSKYSLAGYLD